MEMDADEPEEVVDGLDGLDEGGLDEDDDMKFELELETQDKKVFTLDKKIAMLSDHIKTVCEADQTATRIPHPTIRACIMEKVVEFMQHHHTDPAKEIEKPLKSTNMHEVEWITFSLTALFSGN